MFAKFMKGIVLATVTTWALPAMSATIVVDSLADGPAANDGDCTLREAIDAANNDADANDCTASGVYGIDQIDVPLPGTITLVGASGEDLNVSGDLDVIDDLVISNISGGVVTIDGDGNDRIFDVRQIDTNLELIALVIENGNPDVGENGGGIKLLSGGLLSLKIALSGIILPMAVAAVQSEAVVSRAASAVT